MENDSKTSPSQEALDWAEQVAKTIDLKSPDPLEGRPIEVFRKEWVAAARAKYGWTGPIRG